ncbi:OprD family outer membrane porin [Pseudomonas sp. LS1212]|uniref:OprD family outer membrane porin n=1 Tax=Pseudomonas sp. LS1212 TaxID=2972478 RepID=UPI0038CD94E3
MDYKFNDKVSVQYHFASLDEIYRQYFIGVPAPRPFEGKQALGRLASARSDISGLPGQVDCFCQRAAAGQE